MKKTIEQRAREIWNESAFVVPFDAIALGDKGMTKGEYFTAQALRVNSTSYMSAANDAVALAWSTCLALAEKEAQNG